MKRGSSQKAALSAAGESPRRRHISKSLIHQWRNVNANDRGWQPLNDRLFSINNRHAKWPAKRRAMAAHAWLAIPVAKALINVYLILAYWRRMKAKYLRLSVSLLDKLNRLSATEASRLSPAGWLSVMCGVALGGPARLICRPSAWLYRLSD